MIGGRGKFMYFVVFDVFVNELIVLGLYVKKKFFFYCFFV